MPETAEQQRLSQHNQHLGRLDSAVADSRTLLQFMVEGNRKLDPKVIDAITAAIEKVHAQLGMIPAATVEDEFWKAYEDLTEASSPVTAESIRASAEVRRARLGTTGWYSLVSMFVFVVVVILQCYWFIGNDLRREQRDLDKKIEEQDRKGRDLSAQIRVLEIPLRDLNRDPKVAPPGSEAARKIAELRIQIEPKFREIDVLSNDLEVTRARREPVVELLQGWYVAPRPAMDFLLTGWSPFEPDLAARVVEAKHQISLKGTAIKSKEEEIAKLERDARASSAVGVPNASKLRENWEKVDAARRELTQDRNEVSRLYRSFVVDLTHRVDLLLQVLDRFVIPVMLGMLGALIFILRSLISQIQNSSYVSHFVSLSFVRVCLGMMAGLFGTLFLPGVGGASDALPQATGLLKEIPPLALPLLFGYSVEILFAFMDRFVKAFTETPKP